MGTADRQSLPRSSRSSKSNPGLRIARDPRQDAAAKKGLEAFERIVKHAQRNRAYAEPVLADLTSKTITLDQLARASHAFPDEWGEVYQGLMAIYGRPKWFRSAMTAIEDRADELSGDQDECEVDSEWPAEVLEAWPWLDGRLSVPALWRIGLEGVEGEKPTRDRELPRAASAPLIISGLLRDVETGHEHLRLEWSWGGRPTWQVLPREVALNPTQIVRLAARGAPIDGTRTNHTVRYLVDFEAANRSQLPVGLTCSRMGWVDIGDGRDRYVLGRSVIAPGKSTTEDTDRSPDQWAGDHIHVQAGAGTAELASAHRTGGTWEGWLELVARPASEYPTVKLLMLASLVPPLMRLISGLANAVVDLPGETSTGKTTAQYAAASIWGYPDERGGIVNSWAQTPYWMETTASFLDGLPLFLGDTRNAEGGKMDPAAVANTIYAYAQGRGAGRGSYGSSGSGTRPAGKWSGVLIYTGEVSSVSLSEQGGTRARVLSLHGAPFGAKAPGLADKVDAIKRAAQTHYGHFARRFIAHLVETSGIAERVQEMHAEASAHWRTRAGENRIVHRSAGFLAALEVAAVLAGEVGLPGDAGPALDLAFYAMSAGAIDGDRPRAALASIYEWALSQKHRFEIGDRQPRQDCLGLWAGGDDWEVLAILSTALKAQIKALGHDVETTIRLWGERGWLIQGKEKDHPNDPKSKAEFSNPLRPRMVHIRREAIDSVIAEGEE